MRTAMGAAQWLSLRQHTSTKAALQALHSENCVILASSVDVSGGRESQNIQDIDWKEYVCEKSGEIGQDDGRSAVSDSQASHRRRPLCIVMGNEENGITDEMREACHGTFFLPMVGFAESFNLSVATAITLTHLSSASHSQNGETFSGPMLPGDMPDNEFNCLMLKGLLNSVSQKRVAYALLRQNGINLPTDIHRA
jgi:tRNA G18 (ribose-2'-O)-methylase SpoU